MAIKTFDEWWYSSPRYSRYSYVYAKEGYNGCLEQLKTEISAICQHLQEINAMRDNYHDIASIVEKLRQLSAITIN